MPGQKFELKPGEPLLKSQPSVLEKSVSISLKSIVFAVVAVFLLSGSFFAGRYIFPSTVPIGSVFASINIGANDSNADATESVEETAVAEAAPEAQPIDETVTSEETTKTSETEADIPEEVTPTSESVVTSYSKVKLEFTRKPVFKWNEAQAFGTIKTIYYTVKNNEAGTIKPSYFNVVIEGYSPTERTITVSVPKNTAEIAAGKVVQNAFDKIIAYAASATDPANVKITLQLFDENKKLVASAEQEFNLKG